MRYETTLNAFRRWGLFLFPYYASSCSKRYETCAHSD